MSPASPLLALSIAVCLATVPAGAQTASFVRDSLRGGLRVRIQAPGVARFPFSTGTITTVEPDAFVYKDDADGAVRRVPNDHLRALAVSEGRALTANRLLAGAAIGLFAGLGIARVLDLRDRDEFGYRRTACVRFFDTCTGKRSLLIGTLTGTSLGVAIAALKPGEKWRHIPVR